MDITHNRESKAPPPNSLIHWTAVLLLLQRRRRRKKEAIAAVFQRHERCLISLCHLSFSFHLHISVSTTYFPSSSPVSPQSRISSHLSLLSFFFFLPLSTCNFSWISFSLDSSKTVLRAICFRTELHYSPLRFVLLHRICRQSFVYVTTTCNLETFSLATSQSRKVLLFHPSVGTRGNSQGGLTTP